MLSVSSSGCDPSPTSPLWHPGHAHALVEALASSEVGRIVARHVGAEAGDGESRVERKPRLGRGSRFIKPTEVRQCGGKIDMRAGMISVDLDRATEPRDRLLVGTELQLGEAREH